MRGNRSNHHSKFDSDDDALIIQLHGYGISFEKIGHVFSSGRAVIFRHFKKLKDERLLAGKETGQ